MCFTLYCIEKKDITLNNIRKFKKTTTAVVTGTSLSKRFNEYKDGCARALEIFVNFFPYSAKQQGERINFAFSRERERQWQLIEIFISN